MRKIIKVLIIFICLAIINVSAKTNIIESNFENIMREKGFKVNNLENGCYAVLEETEYTYTKYATEKEAVNDFSARSKQAVAEAVIKKELDSYNVNNDKTDEYNMIAYETYIENSNYDIFHYIYRIDNYVVVGTGDMSQKNDIKNTIEKIVSNVSSTKPTQNVERKSNSTMTICGIFLGITLIITILLISPKKNNKKKNEKKR